MSPPFHFPGRRWLLFLTLVIGLGFGGQRASAQIDYGIDQTVWMMLYGVTAAQMADPTWLARDDDGDGVSNGAELAAGTNPFDPTSNFVVSATALGANGMALTFPTVAGKQYVLQTTTDVTTPSSWQPLSPAVTAYGTGAPMTLSAPPGSSPTNFYRVAVQDVDTDGDGVSDWAEIVTGFNPTTPYTNGATINDHTALTNDLLVENVITVAATKATATQPVSASVAATDMGTITVTRGGTLHFSAITVPLTYSGTAIAGLDYVALPATVTFPAKVGVVTLTVVPLANPGRLSGATVTVSAVPTGGGYTLGPTSTASAVINPAGNANGTGLTGSYYNGTSKTVSPYQPTVLFAGTPALQRLDAGLNFNWNSGSPGTGVNATYFGVRWQGQVQPQFSETYYFDVVADDGFKLWVNGQLIIDSWTYISSDRLGTIALQAGVLYDIQIDYYQAGGADQMVLNWYSNSQPKQVIPATRLYPLTNTAAAPAITSAMTAFGFVNQPFNFNVTASTSGGSAAKFGLGAGSGPLPPGLALNATTGLISGTPTAAGSYQVALTASNTVGVGASVLNIQILYPGSGVSRELWSGLGGANISDIPLTSAPASIDTALTTPEDNAAYPNYTGERLRGYFTAPVTGNYYFWIAGNNNAELWISDDNQTVNLTRRAWVAAPGTTPENWTNSATQRSPWLALVAGQQYYYEVLHNTGGAGASSNVSAGYVLDSTGQATTPVGGNTQNGGSGTASGVVPAYLVTQYGYPVVSAMTGALYVTNLSPTAGSTSQASGSANLQLNSAKTQAILHFNYSGLSSAQTSYAVYGPDDNGSVTLLFDLNVIDKFRPDLKTADGGYTWNIASTSAVSTTTIVNDIQGGMAFLLVETVNYPNGEISGNFGLVLGSQVPPVLVPDPGFTDDSAGDPGAARFLNQAAFGAAPADLAAVEANGYAAWINSQISLPATHLLPSVLAQIAAAPSTDQSASYYDNAWWNAAVTAPDQLRQRVALALSEIMVISDTNSTISNVPTTLASYQDTLADNAFGNFRTLLEAVTLHPGMGYWLNMQGNAQGNLATGYHPNENYAREVMQLFTIGLNRLWPDGSTVLSSAGSPVPTYTQNTITNGFARVFTGWTWNQARQASGQLPTSFYPATDWVDPMVMVKNYHELGTKTILDNVVLPGAVGYNPPLAVVAGSQADTTTATYDSYCLADLESGLNNIFNHPNVGPLVCRQLIQRLVESNPSPAYLYRVVAKFNDDGTSAHVRGNLTAVISAILLDSEARNAAAAWGSTTAGKQREPLLRITGPARTFLFNGSGSATYNQSGSAVTTINTLNPNRYSSGDVVDLDFTVNDTGNPPVEPANNPTSGGYTVLSTPAPTANSFAVNAMSLASVNCSEAAGTNTLTVSTSGPAVGEEVYLKFLTGGFTDGIYTVATIPSGNSFTVTVGGSAPAGTVTGTVIVPKATGYDNITKGTGTNPSAVTIATNSNTNLNPGDTVWIAAGLSAQLKDAVWTVASVIDARHFTVTNTAAYASEGNQSVTLYPLVPPPLSRSGNVGLPASKFDMGNTNSVIVQTPLDSPTVFNFYYPNYLYPGSLSTNNVTAPEFELTTDSNIITLSNTVDSTILSSNNTSGLSNFKSGAINLDLSAYMGAPYCSVSTVSTTKNTTVTAVTTTTVDANGLITKLGNLLTGGMFNQNTQAVTALAAFINNTTYFPPTQTATGTTTVPPAAPTLPTTSARDKVRAVVQQILVSPDYAIQR